jgi:CBS domain-containing protein
MNSFTGASRARTRPCFETASYVAFAAILGTEPLLDLGGPARFGLVDLVGALLLGIAAGVGARLFAYVLTQAKGAGTRVRAPVRVAAAGLSLASVAVLAQRLFDAPLTIGPGYDAVRWAVDPAHGLALVAALFLLRGLATSLTVAGGGAGGVFIPLVVQGALLGRVVGGLLPGEGHVLFPLVGVAAFLGAGYRTPIAAVMFVAESTGRPGFVVPALVATAAAQLVMGRASVSPYQRVRRSGRAERRLDQVVADTLRADIAPLEPDVTLDEFVHDRVVRARVRVLPVVDDGTYVGIVRLRDVDAVPRDRRADTTVSAIATTDVPTLQRDDTLRTALTLMQRADIDLIAVVESDSRFLGAVRLSDVVNIEELLATPGSEQA